MICPEAGRRLDLRSALIAGLGLALPIALATAALAQDDKSDRLDVLKQNDKALEARAANNKSAESEAALKREIEQIGADRRKLNQGFDRRPARGGDAQAAGCLVLVHAAVMSRTPAVHDPSVW